MIFVTGGTGLLGSHLIYELTRSGKKVRALRRKSTSTLETLKVFEYYETDPHKLFDRIEWVEGDLSEPDRMAPALEGVREIYHLAALVSFDRRDRNKMEAINVNGTANMVNLAIRKSIDKFCFVSSVAAIGPTREGEAADESCIYEKHPDSHWYAWTKFKSEMEVWRGIAEGLNAVIVNPSIILGPGNWHRGAGQMFQTLHRGLAFYPPGITGYVGVKDVVSIMIRLMDESHFGERFLLNAENLYFKELFGWMAEALHKKPPGIKTRPWMMQFAWRLFWLVSRITGSPPAITRESARAGFNRKFFSSNKITALLDFRFEPIREVIRETAGIYLKDSISKNHNSDRN